MPHWESVHCHDNKPTCKDGWVEIALLDADGEELPGYGFAQAVPIGEYAGRAQVEWRGVKQLPIEKEVRFSIRFDGDVALYAVSFME